MSTNEYPKVGTEGVVVAAPQTTGVTPEGVTAEAPKAKDPMSIDPARPTVKIWGCGGCGINLVRRFMTPARVQRFKGQVVSGIIDTSGANLGHGETSGSVISDTGSGKVRRENVDIIKSHIGQLYANSEPEDAHIVLFSMSGGSGSVIGPLGLKDMKEVHGKAVIAIGIADTRCQLDATNSMMTLKTLESIASMADIYIPTMLFTNTGNGATRADVDAVIEKRLDLLTRILTSEVKELDKKDRLHFLMPEKTVGVGGGIFGLHVYEGDESFFPCESQPRKEEFYDSVVVVANSERRELADNCAMNSRVIYTGHYPKDRNMTSNAIYGVVGGPVSSEIVKEIDGAVKRFETVEQNKGVVGFKTKHDADSDSSGLVL
jgi:hypothetical protein